MEPKSELENASGCVVDAAREQETKQDGVEVKATGKKLFNTPPPPSHHSSSSFSSIRSERVKRPETD